MKKKTWTDDELVDQFIFYSTLQNIVNRKNRGLSTQKYLKMGQLISAELHDIKKNIGFKKMKVMRIGTDNRENEFSYMLFKNGWRSEHTMKKTKIQDEVSRLYHEFESIVTAPTDKKDR